MAVSHRELGAPGRGREVAAALRAPRPRAPPPPGRGHGSLGTLPRRAPPHAAVGQRPGRSAPPRPRRADRDDAAFASFLADETVFLMGGKPQRGKAAVADYWKRFYTEPKAPFSWKPDYSTGRREDSGVWRIVFDDGCNFKCA